MLETRPEDTLEEIGSALKRRPFDGGLYVDFSHEIVDGNQVVQRMLKHDIDCFILDCAQKVIAIGNPQEDFQFMLQMAQLPR